MFDVYVGNSELYKKSSKMENTLHNKKIRYNLYRVLIL